LKDNYVIHSESTPFARIYPRRRRKRIMRRRRGRRRNARRKENNIMGDVDW
jgi:hypothetical protein